MEWHGIFFQFLQFGLLDGQSFWHDMDTIVDNTKAFTTVILNGIVIIKINYIVVSFIHWKLFNVVAINIGGQKGSINSCSLSIFNTAIISVSSLRWNTDIALCASTISFEKCSSLGLVFSHFIPFSQIVVYFITLGRWRSSTTIA